MNELYSKEKDSALSAKLARRWIVLGVVAAALAAVFAWTMAVRGNWHEIEAGFPLSETVMEVISIASVVLLGFFAVFWIELFCLPLIRYRSLVRTALTGRSHTRAFEFVRVEPDPSVVDGIPFRSLIFLGDPDKHGTRDQLFYWDQEIPLPDLQPGAEYELKYTGKNIIAISA